MPGFLYNVVTQAGAALIAQATAANQIVFVAALSKATAATSADELAVQPAGWYDGKSGSIAAASATVNVARIIGAWAPAGSRQAAKSMCVTARLASQTDAQAVPVIALSDPDSTIELPGADDTSGAVSIPFLAEINASGDVEVTPGAAASIADLARFVSLHSAGNPNTGDDQTILGVKSFADGISVPSGSTLSIAGALDVTGTASFVGIATTGDVSVGGTATLASAAVTGALSVGGTATLALASVTGALSVGGNLSVTGGGLVLGRLDVSQGLYSSSWIISRASGNQIEGSIDLTQKVSSAYVVRATLSADTDLPSGVTTGLSLSAHHLRPASNEGGSLGTSTYRWDYVLARIVTADRLHGLGEVPGKDQVVSSPLFLPVGAPVLAFIETSAAVTYLAGDIIAPAASGSSVTHLAVSAYTAGTGWVAGQEIMTSSGSSVYRFKLLSQVSATSAGAVALIVRVPSDFDE